MLEFGRERRLWVRPYFFSNANHVLFVCLGWFVRWLISGRIAVVLWRAVSVIFSTVRGILMKYLSSFFRFFVRIYVVHPYSSADTATAWNNSRFILSSRSNFHTITNLSIVVNVFPMRMLASLYIYIYIGVCVCVCVYIYIYIYIYIYKRVIVDWWSWPLKFFCVSKVLFFQINKDFIVNI